MEKANQNSGKAAWTLLFPYFGNKPSKVPHPHWVWWLPGAREHCSGRCPELVPGCCEAEDDWGRGSETAGCPGLSRGPGPWPGTAQESWALDAGGERVRRDSYAWAQELALLQEPERCSHQAPSDKTNWEKNPHDGSATATESHRAGAGGGSLQMSEYLLWSEKPIRSCRFCEVGAAAGGGSAVGTEAAVLPKISAPEPGVCSDTRTEENK